MAHRVYIRFRMCMYISSTTSTVYFNNRLLAQYLILLSIFSITLPPLTTVYYMYSM